MEAMEQFSLCWNNFHNNLSAGFQDLLKDEDLVDVTLAADGRYLKAHKTVLSVCSPYFKELFRVNPCKHPIVILQDVSYGALSALLRFMYQGEVSVSQEEIPSFMRVAEILKVKGLTENANLANSKNSIDNSNGVTNNAHDSQTSQPFVGVADKQPIMKRTVRPPIKKIIKPVQIQYLKPADFPNPSSSSPAYSPSSVKSPQPAKQPRLEEVKPAEYIEPVLTPKQEPVDHVEDEYREPPAYAETTTTDASPMADVKFGGEQGENSFNNVNSRSTSDASSPGTLQCILGKRGLPRLIVDGYTFFKKSTYKNKCFWYCKTNRSYKCPAVCWTVNGRIVKWPEAHTHGIVPEVITPGEDTIVPIEMLRQVLIDAAR